MNLTSIGRTCNRLFCKALYYLIGIWCFSYPATNLAQDTGPSLGVPASAEMVENWNITVFPDGTGLPEGSGIAAEGEVIYQSHCLSCHGPRGEGSLAEELAGGEGTLTDRYPDKTIGLYWPYATTVFDVIRRSMPMYAPGTLDNNQIYALTAYLLAINEVIDESQPMNAITLPTVVMPNRYGFTAIDADLILDRRRNKAVDD